MRNTSATDDAIVQVSDDSGRTNTSLADTRSHECRPTSAVRRICVAPASSDHVVDSPEPPDSIQCSWRPVKPGYTANVGGAVVIEKTVEVEHLDHDDDTDSSFRLAIPVMSRSVAVFCAVCNVLSPGLGELGVTAVRVLAKHTCATTIIIVCLPLCRSVCL